MMDWVLVTSYFFTSWNARADAWSISLFVSLLFPDNLLPISIYSFSSSFCCLLFAPSIGSLVDKYPRLPIASLAIVLQKICITVSAVLLFLKSVNSNNAEMDFYFYGLVANGSLLQLANLVSRISILRDWSSCIAKDATNEISLTKLNSRLRLVDLTCDLAAPVIVSLVSSYSTVQIAMVFVMSVSTISIPVEWSMLRMVYNKFPCLAIKVPRVNQSSGFEWSSLGKLWKLPVITTCFSISILYMTVFTINTVSVGYLLSKNTDMLHISLARGISVISGLSSTFSLEKMVKKIGLNSTGLIAIWLQFFCVALALASFYVPLTSEWQAMGVWMFLGGICLSRWGLWTFDLVQQQLLQENIPEDQLGFVSGTEISLQNFFQMIAYVFTIYWSSPVDFWIPSHISAGAVLTAALSFSFYTLRSTSISVDPESSPLLEHVE